MIKQDEKPSHFKHPTSVKHFLKESEDLALLDNVFQRKK